jgi:hypothetical protein
VFHDWRKKKCGKKSGKNQEKMFAGIARIAKRAVALDDLSAVANVPRDELAQAITSLASRTH